MGQTEVKEKKREKRRLVEFNRRFKEKQKENK